MNFIVENWENLAGDACMVLIVLVTLAGMVFVSLDMALHLTERRRFGGAWTDDEFAALRAEKEQRFPEGTIVELKNGIIGLSRQDSRWSRARMVIIGGNYYCFDDVVRAVRPNDPDYESAAGAYMAHRYRR